MLYITSFLLLNLSKAAMVLDSINGRFRAEFRSSDGLDFIPGFAKLSIATHFDFQFETNAHSLRLSGLPSDYQYATGARIISGQRVLYLPFNDGEIVSEIEPTLRIKATPNSLFSQMVQGFFFEPISESVGRLHINSDYVTDYAYEGIMLYTPAVIDTTWGRIWGSTDFWGVHTAINLVSPQGPYEETEQSPLVFRPCRINNPGDGENDLMIPSSKYEAILNMISAQGLRVQRSDRNPMQFIIRDITPEVLASLPTIEYILPSVNGEHFTIASIPPTQYIAPTNEPRVYRLLVSPVRIGSEICILTQPILSKLVIHFDTQNNLVGFGEPFIEIE